MTEPRTECIRTPNYIHQSKQSLHADSSLLKVLGGIENQLENNLGDQRFKMGKRSSSKELEKEAKRGCEEGEGGRQRGLGSERQDKDLEYWKNSFLSLERVHEKIVGQLSEELKQKDLALTTLRFEGNSKGNPLGHELKSQSELSQTVESLNCKIEELMIQKQYSQLKEQQWLNQYIRLTKQLSRQNSLRKDEFAQTQMGLIPTLRHSESTPSGMTEIESLEHIKHRLLRMISPNSQSPSTLKSRGDDAYSKTVKTTPTAVSESPWNVRVNKIMNSSMGTFKNVNDNQQAIKTMNNTFSSFTKTSGDKMHSSVQAKWARMKQDLKGIRRDNSVLMEYLRTN